MVNVAVAPQLLDLYAVLDLHMTDACSFHRYFIITNIMDIVIIISATTIIVIIINSLLDTDA